MRWAWARVVPNMDCARFFKEEGYRLFKDTNGLEVKRIKGFTPEVLYCRPECEEDVLNPKMDSSVYHL